MTDLRHLRGVPASKLLIGLSSDDVTLDSGFTEIARDQIKIETRVTRKYRIGIPILSSPMDRVTEAKMAIALGKLKGLGILHRNLREEDQSGQVQEIRRNELLAAAAISSAPGFEKRVDALVAAGVQIIVVDSAHGYTVFMRDTVTWIKKHHPDIDVVGGNVATYDGAQFLIDLGVDAMRTGQGPGSICSTRIVSGVGTPQITAISRVVAACEAASVPVWADGAIQVPGDVTKAIGAKADCIMIGSLFAGTTESPGKIVSLKREQVPPQYHYLFGDREEMEFKEYRGMGSLGAIQQGRNINSETEFHDAPLSEDIVPEGVDGYVPHIGPVSKLVHTLLGGLISGMYYVGARNIQELQQKARFVQITSASIREGRPHDIIPLSEIINPA